MSNTQMNDKKREPPQVLEYQSQSGKFIGKQRQNKVKYMASQYPVPKMLILCVTILAFGDGY